MARLYTMIRATRKSTVRWLAVLLAWNSSNQGCKPEITGSPIPNQPPITRLANIPVPNDSANPYPYRLALSWDGGDFDGVVVGFRYRWGDHEWQYTTERSGTFDFESPKPINRHTFVVKAVDNEGAEDPDPPSLTFYTAQTSLPTTRIVSGPVEGEIVFCLAMPTAAWQGIEFKFEGHDEDGSVVGFEYTIDDTTEWRFTPGGTARVFGLADGEHTLFVRAVDNAKGIDPSPAARSFRTIVPGLDRGIVVVNETRNGTGVPGSPTAAEVDRFYTTLLKANNRPFARWDHATQGAPSVLNVAPYSLIVWHGDDRSEQLIKGSVGVLRQYLAVGGKLWLVGWRVVPELDNLTGLSSHDYRPGEFGYDVLRLDGYREQTALDFHQATGVAGFPSVRVDAAKLPQAFAGRINFVCTLRPREAVPILLFGSSLGSEYQNRPCAIKHVSNGSMVVVFGFPLYFMVEADAIAVAGRVLSDLDE